MDKAEITALRQQAIAKITPQFGAMERDDLVELLAQETQEANPRETLVKAVTDELEKRDALENEPPAADDADAKKDDDAADKAAPASAPRPSWQEPDYLGPLDGEQADWRNRHLKPTAAPRRKD